MKKVISITIFLTIVAILFSGCSSKYRHTKAPVHKTEKIYNWSNEERKDVYLNSVYLSNDSRQIIGNARQDLVSSQYYNIKSYYNETTRRDVDGWRAINMVNPAAILLTPKNYVKQWQETIGKTKEHSKTDRHKYFTGKKNTKSIKYNGSYNITFNAQFDNSNKFSYHSKGNNSVSSRYRAYYGNINVNLVDLVSKFPIPPVSGTVTVTINGPVNTSSKTINIAKNDIYNILRGYKSKKWSWVKYTLYDKYKYKSKSTIKKELINQIIAYHKVKNYSDSVPYFEVLETLLNFSELPNSFDYLFAKSVFHSPNGNKKFVEERLNDYLRKVNSSDRFYQDAQKLLQQVKS